MLVTAPANPTRSSARPATSRASRRKLRLNLAHIDILGVGRARRRAADGTADNGATIEGARTANPDPRRRIARPEQAGTRRVVGNVRALAEIRTELTEARNKRDQLRDDADKIYAVNGHELDSGQAERVENLARGITAANHEIEALEDEIRDDLAEGVRSGR
jgi:hypothetical protein